MAQPRGPAEGQAATVRGDLPALLSVEGVTIRFGGVVALDRVRFEVARGQICGLIGPNGAGKTSLFNCISRLYDPHAGSIRFDGQLLEQVPRHAIAALGIARTFQNIRLFPNMTAMENVMVARHSRTRSEFFSTLFMTRAFRAEEQEMERAARELLARVGLLDRGNALAKNLPYGEQRRLEIARALALDPKLLLLDEPTAGMNPSESEELMRFVQGIQQRGVTILLIEHQMRVVMNLCHRVVVLDYGEKIADGTPSEIQRNTAVIQAYLGGGSVPAGNESQGLS